MGLRVPDVAEVYTPHAMVFPKFSVIDLRQHPQIPLSIVNLLPVLPHSHPAHDTTPVHPPVRNHPSGSEQQPPAVIDAAGPAS